ncbi:MAG: FAD-dependent oxidoreductase, partial [Bacteroidales bacterium]|nr:FAD-dependent oxidoreductase [Bacteroidales bacterium]
YQLASIMKKQAQKFGCTIKSNIKIEHLELSSSPKRVILDDGNTYTADAIILSPGGRSRLLNVPGEEQFKGKGISYCATCDGDFFQDKEIFVVGGGNSALEEAVSLTKYASKVTIIHQFDHFQAFEHAIEEARSNPKINFIMESGITSFQGDESLKGISIKNLKTGIETYHNTDGVFIFIGYIPNTEFLKDQLELNKWGEIIVKPDMSTSIEGVYAAGDSITKRFRQVTTAVGDGTIAALAASQYVNDLKAKRKVPELI